MPAPDQSPTARQPVFPLVAAERAGRKAGRRQRGQAAKFTRTAARPKERARPAGSLL